MSKEIPQEVQTFVSGLKLSKNLYVECPECQFMFSLYSARLVYGKSPPKDMLSNSEKQVSKALEELASFQESFEEEKDKWKTGKEILDSDWRNKLNLRFEEWSSKERTFKEKIRHMKSDVAATQKEIIKEKVDRALLSQRGVIEGHIAELFPLFRKTRINPADLCSLIPTTPVDFVVFDGLFNKEVSKVTFLDVKKGGAQLSSVQKSIRDTIKDGNVEFKKIRVNFDSIKGHAEEES
jgi:predicted Holliday junction resolvase-like endonuclease